MAKNASPISKDEFHAKAQTVKATIDGKEVEIPTKEFSTGSLGWYTQGKITMTIDGKQIPCQMGLSLTIIGSKP